MPAAWFDNIAKRDHEGVFFCNDNDTGLRAIIAIHDTTLGPALGGCRIKHYQDDAAGLTDVLRLSRAMSYKASISGLNLGGGKSVILLKEGQEKSPELLAEFAKRVDMLQGSYITAGDIGSTTTDLQTMRQITQWVVGLAEEDGGLGDSAILTSLGVFKGIQAAVKARLGRDDMDGLHVAVQGAGKVGQQLIGRLLAAGCKITVTDAFAQAVAAVKAEYPQVHTCEPDAIYSVDADIFSPNAIGGLITMDVAKQLQCSILAGGANNPLAEEGVAALLGERNILYAPDFVINAGGLIMVASEIEKHTFAQAETRVNNIYEKTLQIFNYAEKNSLLPWDAARQMAENRINQSRHLAKEAVKRSTSMFANTNDDSFMAHSQL